MTQKITIYGIKNCDTVKKALKWLAENNLEYKFHDYKKDGVNEEVLKEFIAEFSWQKILNQKSRTWRLLSEELKPTDQASAIKIMKEQSSIIKRPLIDSGTNKTLGFDPAEYEQIFNK